MTDFEGVNAYPLSWPQGRPRTEASARKRASFGWTGASAPTSTGYRSKQPLTIAVGTGRVYRELERMGVPDFSAVLSTNVELNRHGVPYSGRRAPEDPGVAIYFKLDGVPIVLACDLWDRVADNLAAVAAHIGALRGIERWGVGSLAQSFAGFMALPERAGHTPWWTVLGLDAPTRDRVAVRAAFALAARKAHPDVGGSHELFVAVTKARDEGFAYCDAGA